MSPLLSRRRVIGGLGALAVLALSGCGRKTLDFIHGKNLTGQLPGLDFSLSDPDGKVRSLADFRGKIPMVFFGFTQCPVVCPTTLARAKKIKRLLGSDGDRLQVIFISLDPERDSPALIKAYMQAFDPSFIGLYGSLEATAKTAKDFGVTYEKIPTATSYTLAHSASSYVFDANGQARLMLAHGFTAEQCVEDLQQVFELG